jgi:hypothetical protein
VLQEGIAARNRAAQAQTFDMAFAQYIRHPESKSLAPDGTRCNGDTCGLLGRYPVTASGFHLIGKETERGWEQSEEISTLLPSLMRYQGDGVAGEQLRQGLLQIPLCVLERETGMSRQTTLRVRSGKRVHSLLGLICLWAELLLQAHLRICRRNRF